LYNSISAKELSSKAEVIDASKVPKSVMNNFKIYYPVAKVIRWEREKTVYKVYVVSEKVKEVASFEYDGDWVQTEQYLKPDQIPLKAHDFIKEKFPLYSIGECSYISYVDGVPSYLVQVHLKSSKDYIRPLLFDITGAIKKIDGLDVRQTGDITADDYTDKRSDSIKTQTKPNTTTEIKNSSIVAGEKVVRISDVIMKQFRRRFPRAEKISWIKEGKEYIAKFTNYDQIIEAVFLEDGMQVYTSYPFFKHNMPFPIEQHFKNESKKYKFVQGKRVVYESKYRRSVVEEELKPKDFYEVIMSYRIPKSKETEYYRFRFNQTGQLDFQIPHKP
jgi:hypothetical protein